MSRGPDPCGRAASGGAAGRRQKDPSGATGPGANNIIILGLTCDLARRLGAREISITAVATNESAGPTVWNAVSSLFSTAFWAAVCRLAGKNI